MAPSRPKRKRTSTDTNQAPNKRRKNLPSSSSNPDTTFYEARAILEERIAPNGELEYLIDWAGTDPDTGRKWEDSWVRADDATDPLIEEWEKEKARRRASALTGKSIKRRGRGGSARPSRPATRSHESRVVESDSPEPSTTLASEPPSILSTPTQDSTRASSFANTTAVSNAAPRRPRTSPRVEVGKQSDIPREEFDRWSQLPPSEVEPDATKIQQGDFTSQHSYTAARDYRSSGVVPDSSNSDSGASYIPTATETSRSLTDTTGAGRVETQEFISSTATEEPLSRAPSPTISIPETVADSILDSQAQGESSVSRVVGQIAIPGTLEIVDSSSQEAQPSQPVERNQGGIEEHTEISETGVEVSQQAAQAISEEQEQQESEEGPTNFTPIENPSEAVEESQVDCQDTANQQVSISNSERNQLRVFDETPADPEAPKTTAEQSINPAGAAFPIKLSRQCVDSREAEESLTESSASKIFRSPIHSQSVQPSDEQLTVHQTPSQQEPLPTIPEQNAVDSPAPQSEQYNTQSLVQTNNNVADQVENLSQDPAYSETIKKPPQLVEEHVQLLGCEGPEEQLLAQSACQEHDKAIEAHLNTVTETTEAQQSESDTSTGRRDFAVQSQVNSIEQSTPFIRSPRSSIAQPEQNAQVVPEDIYINTQDGSANSVLPTIEKPDTEHARPGSRHDSSQQSPAPQVESLNNSSPAPHPPFNSIGTLLSHAPSRPQTPVTATPCLATMAHDYDEAEAVAKDVRDIFDRIDKTPYEKKKRTLAFSSPGAGTRSPSTIPDRSPATQAPTSLRTVALANASEAPFKEPSPKLPAPPIPILPREEPVHEATPPVASPVLDPEDEASDPDDNDSLFNDDLQLLPGEYIVPLPIDGRQSDMYEEEIKKNLQTFSSFMDDPQAFNDIHAVEAGLQRLRSIETHIDLLYSESQTASSQTSGPTLIQFQAQWSTMNSVKFMFLGTLFHAVRDHAIHIILVLESDDDRLFSIVETFLQAKMVNYSIPTKARGSGPIGGKLLVTVISSSSAPLVQPANLIVCLDGALEGAKIRSTNWGQNSDRALVPILHLVIPQTVGHIERYVSPALNTRKRVHTVIASLAQIQKSIGEALVAHTPRPVAAADQVAAYLISHEGENGEIPDEWPLPSIGSIKEVIEYQSQQSQEEIQSPTPGPRAMVSSKRPLEHEELDPAKRMRFTPQPAAPSSSENNEVTHVSDSMPGTAVQLSKLQEHLASMERAYQREKSARIAEEKRFREHEASWNKQQTSYENLHREHRVLRKEHDETKARVEKDNKTIESLRERVQARNTDLQDLKTRFEQLEAVSLASPEQKTVEITRLHKELANAKDAEARAIRKGDSEHEMAEYTKDQYRKAQEAAAELADQIAVLTPRLEKAEHEASGELTKLKHMHLDRSYETIRQRYDNVQTENTQLKRLLQQKEDEVARLKNSRGVGVGTRAQSVGTRTSRPGSRATSPMGNRDRLANLRNG